jgi:hypothetical protein
MRGNRKREAGDKTAYDERSPRILAKNHNQLIAVLSWRSPNPKSVAQKNPANDLRFLSRKI